MFITPPSSQSKHTPSQVKVKSHQSSEKTQTKEIAEAETLTELDLNIKQGVGRSTTMFENLYGWFSWYFHAFHPVFLQILDFKKIFYHLSVFSTREPQEAITQVLTTVRSIQRR